MYNSKIDYVIKERAQHVYAFYKWMQNQAIRQKMPDTIMEHINTKLEQAARHAGSFD